MKPSLGGRIEFLRNERSMSQRELGRQTNLTSSTISRIESDVVIPKINTVILIANIFDVSTDYLCGLTDKKDRL